jgi:IS1 family transposase
MLANRCKDCGRQFVPCSDHYRISGETRALPERLLRECNSLRGMCRAVGVGLTWLVGVLVTCFEAMPDHGHVQPVTWHGDVMMRRREVEADAMASLIQKKVHKPWLWLAMDATSRHVCALYVGDGSRTRARRLWATMPLAYWPHATFAPDQYGVSAGGIPAAQHRALSTLARTTTHRERCKTTRRQRVSRLLREALSCSKKLAHPMGASTSVLGHDTRIRAAADHGVHAPQPRDDVRGGPQ